MRCVRCEYDSKYSERYNRTCPRCGGRFAFEPRQGDPFTDKRFKSAIERVSARGKVKFLSEHVRFDLARDRGTDLLMIATVVSGIATVGLIIAAFATGGLCAVAAPIAFSMTAIFGVSRWLAPPPLQLTSPTFEILWRRYIEAHGEPAGLVKPRLLKGPSEPLRNELVHYSFDRAVICDNRSTASVLLANDFHFENNCAVLTADGYPQDIFQTVRQMLRNNPKLEVFVLHDATPEGCALAQKLRTDSDWFANYGTVYDVAMRPAQARRWQRMCEPALGEAPSSPGYTEEEREWLSRYRLSLAVLPPEQLIKRLFRAMHELPARRTDAASPDGGALWLGDASASDGGGDSFG